MIIKMNRRTIRNARTTMIIITHMTIKIALTPTKIDLHVRTLTINPNFHL